METLNFYNQEINLNLTKADHFKQDLDNFIEDQNKLSKRFHFKRLAAITILLAIAIESFIFYCVFSIIF